MNFNKRKRWVVLVLLFALILSGCDALASKKADNTLAGLTHEPQMEDLEYLYAFMLDHYPLLSVDDQITADWVSKKEGFMETLKMSKSSNTFGSVILDALIQLDSSHVQVANRAQLISNYANFTRPEQEQSYTLWTDIIKTESVMNAYAIKPKELVVGSEPVSKPRMSNNPAFRTSVIVQDKVAYLRIEDLMVANDELDAEAEKVRAFLEEVKGYEKLIIDMRGLGAGNDLFWKSAIVEPLIKESLTVEYYYFLKSTYAKDFFENRGFEIMPLTEIDSEKLKQVPETVQREFQYYGIKNITIDPKESIDFNGDIYVLTDESMNASADRFASFAKDSGFATLVGETTSPGGLSETALIAALPNSGLVFNFKGDLVMNNDGTLNANIGTQPHIEMLDHDVRVETIDKAISFIVNR